jgi:hypothetical protein
MPQDVEYTTNVVALALDLVRVLSDSGVHTAQDAEDLSDEDWWTALRAVHTMRGKATQSTRPPSMVTRAAVIAVYRDRESNPDPFTGFPKEG